MGVFSLTRIVPSEIFAEEYKLDIGSYLTTLANAYIAPCLKLSSFCDRNSQRPYALRDGACTIDL